MTENQPPPISRRAVFTSRRTVILVLLLAAGGLILVKLRSGWQDADVRDGRQAAARSGEPAYVGATRCAECHPEQAELFAASGHSQTFVSTADTTEFDWLTDFEFRDEDRDVMVRYTADEEGLLARIPEQFPDREFPLDFALGSGTHAVTFLSLIPNLLGQTVGIEHRVSIYGDGSLQLTPGASGLPPSQDVEYFGKVIQGDTLDACIDCHTTTSRIENSQVLDLRPNVQCERCHGPGGGHVAAAESGADDLSFGFNPKTATVMEEIRMCGECHRLPEMLIEAHLEHASPKLEITRTNAKLARFQPVGLLQSPCFTGSGGALRCTSCHDPHASASARPRAVYESICRDCHSDHDVAACTISADDCITCHMPKLEVHPGIAFHDHWIRVRTDEDPQGVADGD